jgi:outer membrane protein assembly factor BamD
MVMSGKYQEAIQAYRQFARFRPSHGEVPYARYKMAEAYFKQIPSDWLLSPPVHELDQGPTREALRQVRRFVLDFPDDRRVADAQSMARQALAILARHELYVAHFYLDQDRPQAAIGRLSGLLSSYEGSAIEAEVMLLLGRTYMQVRDRARARETFQGLMERYPNSGHAREAQSYLEELGS